MVKFNLALKLTYNFQTCDLVWNNPLTSMSSFARERRLDLHRSRRRIFSMKVDIRLWLLDADDETSMNMAWRLPIQKGPFSLLGIGSRKFISLSTTLKALLSGKAIYCTLEALLKFLWIVNDFHLVAVMVIVLPYWQALSHMDVLNIDMHFLMRALIKWNQRMEKTLLI